jgi:hypothetical protein
MLRSTDGGQTILSASVPSNTCPVQVIYDASTSTTVWAAGQGGVLRSLDSGATWNIAGLSGNSAVRRIAQDPTNAQILYAATYNAGAYRTIDGGATWTPLTLPTGNIYDIAVDGAGTAYLGTDQGVLLADGTSASLGLPPSTYFYLWADPTTGGALFTITSRGLYATLSSGR